MAAGSLLSNFISSFRKGRFKGPAGVNLSVDRSSDGHTEARDEAAIRTLDGEGATFTIEYFGPDGSVSTRLITLHQLVQGSQCIFLDAFCHETQSERSFRVDRIRAIYDQDGRKYNFPARYIARILMLDADALDEAIQAYSDQEKPHLARALIRDDVKVLMAIARADGYLHDKEADVIISYLRNRLKHEKLNLSKGEMEKLLHYVRNVNPTDKLIHEALHRLETDKKHMKDLVRTCRDVMKADGFIDDREAAALNEIQAAL